MFGLTPYERRHHMSYYDPFRDLNELEDAFFGRGEAVGFKTDIRELDDKFVLEADMPGFSKEDIKIDINGDCMTISAERKHESEEKDEKNHFIRRERSFGSYTRSFDISNVEAKDIKAQYKDGVLTLDLPKKSAVQPESRRLEIE